MNWKEVLENCRCGNNGGADCSWCLDQRYRCDCEDCGASESPCSCDCDAGEECAGCKLAKDQESERLYEIQTALGVR